MADGTFLAHRRWIYSFSFLGSQSDHATIKFGYPLKEKEMNNIIKIAALVKGDKFMRM